MAPHFGVAYYPEHWAKDRWPEDIRLMQEAGITVVRMAEFAWSTLEPAAGEIDFDWLDEAIDMLASAGIVSVLGTPTAAPPAWLVEKDPEILAADENGRKVQFGNRCHYCVNSSVFHDATKRIVRAMGEHFGSNQNIIGWQLDNEYNRVCYCDRCRELFHQYLANKFNSLENLNRCWTTRYWSQSYSSWDQIPIPIGRHNPGLLLEFQHFITESYRKFQRLQIETLRPYLIPEVWITHNFMGWFDRYDHYMMSEDLDLASWDWYIGTGYHNYLTTGAIHDLTRGFKRQYFWLMETQPGNVNWSSINNSLNKGEVRSMAWHAVAHGADALLYWQWRSALGGQEQYHGSLIDQSGQPRPFYSEAQKIGAEFTKVSKLLSGTTIKNQVALLNSYPDRWSIQWQRHHGDFDYIAHFNHYYIPLAARNIGIDILSAESPLDGYRLVIAPALIILDEQRTVRLQEYVERGGHLVLTIRCGMKDKYNALLPSRQPGPLAELAGVEVEEYYALLDPVPAISDRFEGESRLWAERLNPLDDGVQILARYGPSNGWLDGKIAATRCPTGEGQVYYVGAFLDEISQQTLLDNIAKRAGISQIMETPTGVEASQRVTSTGEELIILINHERSEKKVRLPRSVNEYLSDQSVSGYLELGPYGIAVIQPN